MFSKPKTHLNRHIYIHTQVHTHKNSFLSIDVHTHSHKNTNIQSHTPHTPKGQTHIHIHTKTYIHSKIHKFTYTAPHTQIKHAHRSISTHNHKFIIDIKPISMQSLCTIRYVTFSRPLRLFLNYLIIASFPKETKLFLKFNRYFNKLNVKLGRTLLGFNK